MKDKAQTYKSRATDRFDGILGVNAPLDTNKRNTLAATATAATALAGCSSSGGTTDTTTSSDT
ncbi:MAG: hypothetical protein ABEJ99_05575, partial [Candidatus Nanohaloarchaea archaeon]